MYLSNLFLFGLLTCSPLSEAREPPPIQFTTAPEFSLRDIKGKKHSLSDYKGKVVLINFWATWCAPCIYELPHLQKIYEGLKSEGFTILAVNLDEARNISGVGPVSKKLNLKFPILIDRNRSVMNMYNPSMNLPFSILIDRKGNIYAYFEGYSPGAENEVRKVIEEILE